MTARLVTWAVCFLIGWGIANRILAIGKARTPITPREALFGLIVGGWIITGVVYLYERAA